MTDFRIDIRGFPGCETLVLTALTDAGRALRERFIYDDITYCNDGIVIHYPKLVLQAIEEAGLTVTHNLST